MIKVEIKPVYGDGKRFLCLVKTIKIFGITAYAKEVVPIKVTDDEILLPPFI